jgi:hypothetical protein
VSYQLLVLRTLSSPFSRVKFLYNYGVWAVITITQGDLRIQDNVYFKK